MSTEQDTFEEVQHNQQVSTRAKRKLFNREEALQNAMNLFWQKGYERTSITELCRVMHINSPTLYTHYESKARLFFEVVELYEKRYWEAPNQALFAEPDVRKAVSDYFTAAANILLSEDTSRGCLTVFAAIHISSDEGRQAAEYLRERRLAWRKLFLDRLQKGVAEGRLSPEADIETTATALHAIFLGLTFLIKDNVPAADVFALASRAAWLVPMY